MGPDLRPNARAAPVSLKAAIHVRARFARIVAIDVVKVVLFIILEVCLFFSYLSPPAWSCRVTPLCYVTGTCRCYKSNFGKPYCGMEPRTYHGSQTSMYRGDRHPPRGDYPPEAYERLSRPCENCGEVKKMLKKEYLYPEAYQKSHKLTITMGILGLAAWWYLFT